LYRELSRLSDAELEKNLLAWADEYIERLYPLSPAESCSYYLEPDETCAALKAPR
jgi:hypothetical protein